MARITIGITVIKSWQESPGKSRKSFIQLGDTIWSWVYVIMADVARVIAELVLFQCILIMVTP